MTTSQVAIYFTLFFLALGLLVASTVTGSGVVTFIGMVVSLVFLGYTLWVRKKQA